MKKIIILLVITFTFLFSNTSWGEWTYVTENDIGRKYYYDKDRVRKRGKVLYFWELVDFLNPDYVGGLSMTQYVEFDCIIFRRQKLRIQVYENSKGEGKLIDEYSPKEMTWFYPEKTRHESMYNKICEEHQ